MNHHHHMMLLMASGASVPAWLFDADADIDFDFVNDRHYLDTTEYSAGNFPGTTTRASAAWAFGSDGDLDAFTSGNPRINDNGLTVEGARTNYVPSADMTGATTGDIGSGGALPTGWSENFSGDGATVTITAGQTVNGMDAFTLRIDNTGGSATTATRRIRFGGSAGILGLSAATEYTASIYMSQASGATLPGNPTLGIIWLNSSSGFISANSAAPLPGTTVQRYSLTATSPALTAKATYELTIVAGTIDVTFQFVCPQFEAGGFASTPIMHGSPSSTVRAAETVTEDVTGLIADDQTWLVQWSDLNLDTGADRMLFDLSDGSTANQIQVVAASGDDGLELRFRSGSSDTGTIDLGECPSDGILAFSVDQSAGDVRVSRSGADDVEDTSTITGVPSGTTFTDLYIGSDESGGFQAFGRIREIGHLDGYEAAVDVAALVPSIPIVRDYAGTGQDGANTIDVALPASVTTGDLLLMFVSFVAEVHVITTPLSGWTEIGSGPDNSKVFYRVADGTEGSTVTVSLNGGDSSRASAQMYSIYNYAGTPEATFSASDPPDPASITPSWGSDVGLVISFLRALSSDWTGVPPLGYGHYEDVTGNASSATSRIKVASAQRDKPFAYTTEDPGRWTVSSGALSIPKSFTVAIKPPA